MLTVAEIRSSNYTKALTTAIYPNLNYTTDSDGTPVGLHSPMMYNSTTLAKDLAFTGLPPPKAESLPHSSISQGLIILAGTALSVVTTVGNLLVLLSFRIDKNLQTISNYFLFSLAFADLAIGMISCPLMTLYTALGEWPLGYSVCQAWLSIDYLMSNASVWNLLLISLDRYLSVTRPLSYRPRRTTEKALLMIGATYVLSAILWPPAIIGWPYIEGKFDVKSNECVVQFLKTNPLVTIITIALAFYAPVTIMIYLYARVYCTAARRHHQFRGFAQRKPELTPEGGTIEGHHSSNGYKGDGASLTYAIGQFSDHEGRKESGLSKFSRATSKWVAAIREHSSDKYPQHLKSTRNSIQMSCDYGASLDDHGSMSFENQNSCSIDGAEYSRFPTKQTARRVFHNKYAEAGAKLFEHTPRCSVDVGGCDTLSTSTAYIGSSAGMYSTRSDSLHQMGASYTSAGTSVNLSSLETNSYQMSPSAQGKTLLVTLKDPLLTTWCDTDSKSGFFGRFLTRLGSLFGRSGTKTGLRLRGGVKNGGLTVKNRIPRLQMDGDGKSSGVRVPGATGRQYSTDMSTLDSFRSANSPVRPKMQQPATGQLISIDKPKVYRPQAENELNRVSTVEQPSLQSLPTEVINNATSVGSRATRRRSTGGKLLLVTCKISEIPTFKIQTATITSLDGRRWKSELNVSGKGSRKPKEDESVRSEPLTKKHIAKLRKMQNNSSSEPSRVGEAEPQEQQQHEQKLDVVEQQERPTSSMSLQPGLGTPSITCDVLAPGCDPTPVTPTAGHQSESSQHPDSHQQSTNTTPQHNSGTFKSSLRLRCEKLEHSLIPIEHRDPGSPSPVLAMSAERLYKQRLPQTRRCPAPAQITKTVSAGSPLPSKSLGPGVISLGSSSDRIDRGLSFDQGPGLWERPERERRLRRSQSTRRPPTVRAMGAAPNARRKMGTLHQPAETTDPVQLTSQDQRASRLRRSQSTRRPNPTRHSPGYPTHIDGTQEQEGCDTLSSSLENMTCNTSSSGSGSSSKSYRSMLAGWKAQILLRKAPVFAEPSPDAPPKLMRGKYHSERRPRKQRRFGGGAEGGAAGNSPDSWLDCATNGSDSGGGGAGRGEGWGTPRLGGMRRRNLRNFPRPIVRDFETLVERPSEDGNSKEDIDVELIMPARLEPAVDLEPKLSTVSSAASALGVPSNALKSASDENVFLSELNVTSAIPGGSQTQSSLENVTATSDERRKFQTEAQFLGGTPRPLRKKIADFGSIASIAEEPATDSGPVHHDTSRSVDPVFSSPQGVKFRSLCEIKIDCRMVFNDISPTTRTPVTPLRYRDPFRNPAVANLRSRSPCHFSTGNLSLVGLSHHRTTTAIDKRLSASVRNLTWDPYLDDDIARHRSGVSSKSQTMLSVTKAEHQSGSLVGILGSSNRRASRASSVSNSVIFAPEVECFDDDAFGTSICSSEHRTKLDEAEANDSGRGNSTNATNDDDDSKLLFSGLSNSNNTRSSIKDSKSMGALSKVNGSKSPFPRRHSSVERHKVSLSFPNVPSGTFSAKRASRCSVRSKFSTPSGLLGSGSGPIFMSGGRKSGGSMGTSTSAEGKAAKTLSAILLAFILTWSPYSLIVCISALSQNVVIPESIFTFAYYLCYLNSTVNPFLYALCNPKFRQTYIRILTFGQCDVTRPSPRVSKGVPLSPRNGGGAMSYKYRFSTNFNHRNNNYH